MYLHMIKINKNRPIKTIYRRRSEEKTIKIQKKAGDKEMGNQNVFQMCCKNVLTCTAYIIRHVHWLVPT